MYLRRPWIGTLPPSAPVFEGARVGAPQSVLIPSSLEVLFGRPSAREIPAPFVAGCLLIFPAPRGVPVSPVP